MKWIFGPLEVKWAGSRSTAAVVGHLYLWNELKQSLRVQFPSKVVPSITVHLAPSSSLSLYPQCLVCHKSLKEAPSFFPSLLKLPSLFQGKDKGLSSSVLRVLKRSTTANPLKSSAREKKAPQPAPPGRTLSHGTGFIQNCIDQTEYPWGTLVRGKHEGMTMERRNTLV